MSGPPTAAATVVMPARPRALELVPLLGLVVTLVGAILGGGSLIGTVHENSRRIDTLEVRLARRDEALAQIDVRLARIETTLEILRTQREVAR